MRVGERLGSYTLRREIGEGGIAAVFIAEHATHGHVALKVLREEHASQPAIVSVFLGEPRAQQAVEHENTIEVLEVVADAARPYFVTELARGRTLAELLKGGRLPLSRALHIARQVASVLAHAHDVDVIHRNLKPANVFLVTHDGEADFVKLLELGATRMQSEGEKPIPGTLIGTPAYMAPEQLRQTAGGMRVDMYAFGVLLFELVVGRRPFVGDVGELVRQHLIVPAPRARALDAAVPEVLDALIAQCLEKEPSARPPSMHEVSLALAGLEDRLAAPAAVDTGPGPSFAVPKNTSGYTTVPATVPAVVPDATSAPPPVVSFEDEEPSFPSVTGEHVALGAVDAPGAARERPSEPGAQPRGEPLWQAPQEAEIDPTLRPRRKDTGSVGVVVAAGVVVVVLAIGAFLFGRSTAPAPTEEPPPAPVEEARAPPPPVDVPATPPPPANVDAPPPAATVLDAPKPAPEAPPPNVEPSAAGTHRVAFGSRPAGAQVWIRMDKRIRLLCNTPCEFALPEGKEVLVELRLDGHKSAQKTLTVAEGARFFGTLRPQ